MRLFNPRFKQFRRIFFALVGLGVALVIGFVIWIAFNLPDLEKLENTEADLSTVVYSADGEVLGKYYDGENRVPVKLDQIPDHVKNALIATEDIRFYEHAGIDLGGMLRAVAKTLTGNTQGGSTLTMQLARNLYTQEVGNERSVGRKLKEMVATVFLERKYTKEEILMHYLNTVPFGGVRYGIQSASEYYFGKKVKELNLHESALLIGILKGPSYYNPYRHYERAKARRNVVIDQMEKYDYLTKAQSDSLNQLELSIRDTPGQDHHEGLAPYFREHLRQELKDWCKENDYDMYADGLRVFSTIDTRLQARAEKAVEKHLEDYQKVFDDHVANYKPWERDTMIIWRGMRQSARWAMHLRKGDSKDEIYKAFNTPRPMQIFTWDNPEGIDTTMTPRDSVIHYTAYLRAGVVTIDNRNGEILAWVGGANHRFFQYDHVYQGKRQVGSTFKPFVYTAAFDNGYSPCYEISNMPMAIRTGDNKVWSPRNADGEYDDCIRLRDALAQSVNVPTARLMKAVGPRVVAEYAYRMGITTQLEEVYSLALGTTDLQVMELASAYTTFANKGRWVEPHFIKRIEDRNGNVLETFVPNSRKALSTETAALMIDMLRAVVNRGTAIGLRYTYDMGEEIDICGKTGTTNDNSDGWFVGFTPRWTTAVWVGHADQNVHFRSTALGQGAKLALPIWGIYMSSVYEEKGMNITPRRFDIDKDLDMRVLTDCAEYDKEYPENTCEPQGEAENNSYDFEGGGSLGGDFD